MSIKVMPYINFMLIFSLILYLCIIYVDIQNIKTEVTYIKDNYTTIDISIQRANFVNVQLEELSFGIADASAMAKSALDFVVPKNKDEWYVGLLTTEIDSILYEKQKQKGQYGNKISRDFRRNK